jgi:hypothetical protein
MDLFGDVQPEFGLYNIRPIKDSEVKKLKESFTKVGIQRFKSENSIPLIIPADFFDVESVSPKSDAGSGLPHIVWTDKAREVTKVVAAGGQHRRQALSEWREASKARHEQLMREEKKQLGKKKSEGGDAKLEEMQDMVVQAKTSHEGMGLWMVAIYSQGKANSFANEEH